jgi:hypothetical protein
MIASVSEMFLAINRRTVCMLPFCKLRAGYVVRCIASLLLQRMPYETQRLFSHQVNGGT